MFNFHRHEHAVALLVSSLFPTAPPAFLRLLLSGSALGSSFSSSGTTGASRGGGRGSAAGGMSIVADFGFCGVSRSARRFSSDQLCSTSRRTLRLYTTPSSGRQDGTVVRSVDWSHAKVFDGT